MKKINLLIVLIAFIMSCNNKSGPDISAIKVDIPIERFDQDYFQMDTTRMLESMKLLFSKHQVFYPDFMREILGTSPDYNNPNTQLIARQFFHDYSGIYDSLKIKYSKVDWLKKDLESAFRHVKYYY